MPSFGVPSSSTAHFGVPHSATKKMGVAPSQSGARQNAPVSIKKAKRHDEEMAKVVAKFEKAV